MTLRIPGLIAAGATLMVLSASAPALAGNASGQHARICGEITQRHRVAHKPMEQREINFFLFDAAGRGCND